MHSIALIAASMACFGMSLGHIMITSPVPFGQSTLNTSPLVNTKPGSSGSDYPCKQRTGVYDITAMNNMKVGDAQELNFTGSASHGGGTCLLAISLDKEPDYKSVWKVIQVFEGGCPITAAGNDGTHPFTYTIPEGFPNGQSTLSWTWYNRIGNREIYQNCAPIMVTGGSDNKDVYNSLPNLYVVNLPSSECSTIETADLIVPFPGQFVMEDSKSLSSATGPSCAASAAAQTSGVSGYKSATSNDGAAYSAPANGGNDKAVAPASGAAQATSAVPASSSTAAAMDGDSSASQAASAVMGGESAAPGSSASSADQSSFPTMAVSSDAGMSGPATAVNPATPVGTASSGSLQCSSDGAKFGLVDAGGNTVWQNVAPGTQCVSGQIVKRSMFRNARVRRNAQDDADNIKPSMMAAHPHHNCTD